MTEAEWLASAPFGLREHLDLSVSPRKQRLFGVACCRRIWRLLQDDEQRSRKSVDVSERFADGNATIEELQEAHDASEFATDDVALAGTPVDFSFFPFLEGRHHWFANNINAAEAAHGVSRPYSDLARSISMLLVADQVAGVLAAEQYPPADFESAKKTCDLQLAEILRDIVRNPFRPVTFDPAWRTATVTSLAQAIYDNRRFADLPILADALEDAGCANGDVLRHCRTPGEHVRGCWVVDLVLGKE